MKWRSVKKYMQRDNNARLSHKYLPLHSSLSLIFTCRSTGQYYDFKRKVSVCFLLMKETTKLILNSPEMELYVSMKKYVSPFQKCIVLNDAELDFFKGMK